MVCATSHRSCFQLEDRSRDDAAVLLNADENPRLKQIYERYEVTDVEVGKAIVRKPRSFVLMNEIPGCQPREKTWPISLKWGFNVNKKLSN